LGFEKMAPVRIAVILANHGVRMNDRPTFFQRDVPDKRRELDLLVESHRWFVFLALPELNKPRPTDLRAPAALKLAADNACSSANFKSLCPFSPCLEYQDECSWRLVNLSEVHNLLNSACGMPASVNDRVQRIDAVGCSVRVRAFTFR